ncbi:hypothetical protein PUR49_27275 [Streptomyces sp. BE147]|uniref:hypothetical protein n=1 Tax=Streptomyces sp. BE147 TaxID=3002524 RepID=UPI002E7704B3|nr:hypothetical protein [Streptomyces sp. BE147]MEE1740173.1 hypothetical protein [Streptomyces sp. BE147]
MSRLVPIQRTVAEQDLVIGTSGFEQSLTTRQDTALGSPLGHLVSPEAPAGLVHGVTAPVPVGPQAASTAQRTVEMPMRRETVPGREAVSLPVPAAVPVPASAPAPVPAPVQRVHGGGGPAMTSVGEGAFADLPVRQLVGEQPLVAPPAPPPTPAAGVSGAVQRAVGSSASAGEPPRRVPGLGAPLPGLPPTAQRQAAASVPGAAGEGGAEAVGEAAGEAGRPDAGEVTAPLLGDDPLVGVVSGEGEGEGEVGGEGGGGVGGRDADGGSSAGAAPVQRSVVAPAASAVPTVSVLPTAPLLGDRPLVPRTAVGTGGSEGVVGPAVQRSPADGEASRAGPSAAAPDVVGPGVAPFAVPVRWTTADPGASAVASVGPIAARPVPVQRAAVPFPGGVPSPPFTPSRLPVQRKAGGGPPPVPASVSGAGAGGLSGGGGQGAIPTAGAFAVAAGVAQRMPDGSVVFPIAPSSSFPSSPSFASGTSRPVVQRDAEISEEPPPPDPAPEPGSVPDSVPDMEPEPGPDAASADGGDAGTNRAAGAGAGRGGAPVVTDELVRALYAPLSRLLKADLRLERERAGFLINTRH